MSIFCKVGAPGYVSSVVFGVVVNVASICGVLTIDKVMYYGMKWKFSHFNDIYADMQ